MQPTNPHYSAFMKEMDPEQIKKNQQLSTQDQTTARSHTREVRKLLQERQKLQGQQRVKAFQPEDLSIQLPGGKVYAQRSIGQKSYQQDRCGAFQLDELTQLDQLDQETIFEVLFTTFMQLGEQVKGKFKNKLSGTTLTMAVVVNGCLYTAHVGDSDAMLLGEDAIQLTWEHKATCDVEKARIKEEGGFVWGRRLGNQLLISRALGNDRIKGKSYIPSLNCYQIKNEEKQQPLLVIASDGFWDVCCDTDVLTLKQQSPQADEFAKACVAEADKQGSEDNDTVLVTSLYNNSVFFVADGHGDHDDVVNYVTENLEKVCRAAVQTIIAGDLSQVSDTEQNSLSDMGSTLPVHDFDSVPPSDNASRSSRKRSRDTSAQGEDDPSESPSDDEPDPVPHAKRQKIQQSDAKVLQEGLAFIGDQRLGKTRAATKRDHAAAQQNVEECGDELSSSPPTPFMSPLR